MYPQVINRISEERFYSKNIRPVILPQDQYKSLYSEILVSVMVGHDFNVLSSS